MMNRVEHKKFKKLQREVDKMAAMMKDDDDNEDGDEDEDEANDKKTNDEADEKESEEEDSESDEESEEETDNESGSEPEVCEQEFLIIYAAKYACCSILITNNRMLRMI